MLLLLLVGVCGILVLVGGWIRLRILGARRAEYTIRSASEIEPFVRSWGQWLEDRGRIVVCQPSSGADAEFRKQRFKTRPDVLVFRYRNADGSRDYFAETRSRFDQEGVAYVLERTRKRERPRAIAVSLDPTDVFTPVAASRLLTLAFSESGAGLQVFCEGRFRRAPDVPSVRKISATRAHQVGYKLGSRLGQLLSPHRAE